MSPKAQVVFCTCPDIEAANILAHALVSERLAACVNIVPGIRSVYRWQGEVHEDSEFLLIAKTSTARVAELTERAVALHPYECPEVIALPVEQGFAGYLNWISEQTQPGQGG
ncbi:MAG: periplasmic divalent cation tolerance protein [Myxococcota bacterium]|jgi:periplasmic divalent cation tolerance protein